MEELIKSKLKEIEEKENIKILHCVESGSRAWGFASPDSDYDVRFIYVRPKEYYLRLDKTRDVIEWQLDETLDIIESFAKDIVDTNMIITSSFLSRNFFATSNPEIPGISISNNMTL